MCYICVHYVHTFMCCVHYGVYYVCGGSHSQSPIPGYSVPRSEEDAVQLGHGSPKRNVPRGNIHHMTLNLTLLPLYLKGANPITETTKRPITAGTHFKNEMHSLVEIIEKQVRNIKNQQFYFQSLYNNFHSFFCL